tara:strand:- start:292 stop:726 length:435 start_codon:yes stop_codon:yes gene_type:complete
MKQLSGLNVLELSTTERDAITWTNGNIIYNTTLNKFQGYENSAWVNLSDTGGGGTSPSLRDVSTTDTFSAASETINCTSGTFTVNLPTAVGIQGTVYTLVNSGTGVITLDASGTEEINGSLTIDIKRQYVSRTVQSDNVGWIII